MSSPAVLSDDAPGLFDQLFRFLGLDLSLLPVDPTLLRGYLSHISQRVSTLGSLLAALRPGDRRLFLRCLSCEPALANVLMTESATRLQAFRGLFARRPSYLFRTSSAHLLERACARLGVDASTTLQAAVYGTQTMVFFAEKSGRRAIVHMASDPVCEPVMANRRRGLELLAASPLPASLRRLVPELLPSPELPGHLLLTQTRVAGKAIALSGQDSLFYATIDRALAPLLDFPACPHPTPEGPDAERLFVAFADLPERWTALASILTPLLAALHAWQRTLTCTPVLTHGDYWVHNLTFDETTGELAGIFDWDRARPDGIPGLDAIHLVITSVVERKTGDNLDLLIQMWTGQWETPQLAECIARVVRDFKLRPEDLGYLAAIFYCEELFKLADPSTAFAVTRVHKMRSLEPVIQAWLATCPSL